MIRQGLLLLCAALLTAVAPPAPRPRLVVAIAVDQFSAELFSRYRSRLTGGVGRLSRGIAFANGYQSHAATETCPGHSTILTGMHPAATGIVANRWYDRASKSQVYCVGVPGSADPDARGAQNLRVDTLGDWLKAASPKSRVIALSGKDRAAIMMAGHHPDAVYWWMDGKGFRTMATAGPADPDVTAPAEAFDGDLFAGWAKKLPRLWPARLPADCPALVRPHRFGAITVSGEVPPLDSALAAGTDPKSAEFQSRLRASPFFDPLALQFATRLVEQRRLGRGPATDLLAISLSSTDYVGHRYGNGGAEMCVQLHALDRALGTFLARLDALEIRYAVVLTADHGAVDAAERASEAGLPAQRIDGGAMVKALNQYLQTRLGLADKPIAGDDPDQLSIAVGDDPVLRDKVRDEAVAWLKARKEFAAVFTAAEIAAAVPPPGKPADQLSLAERFHESYDPARSGDIAVALAEYATVGMPKKPGDTVAGHGSPWNYDRRVPILFWWRGIAASDRSDAIETVDIAPTLAALIGLAAPKVDGDCLAQVTTRCPPAPVR